MAAFDPVLKQFVANGSFLTVADMNTGTLSPDKAQVTYSPIMAPQFQGSVIGVNGASPVHPTMTVTDGPIDQKASDIYYDGNGMQFRFLNDSYLTSTTWLAVLRTGTAATLVTLTAPVINLAGMAKVSGYPIFHSGNLSFGTGLTLTNGVLTSIGGVGGGSSPIATATTVGTIKPGPLGTLGVGQDGSLDVVVQNITAGTPPTLSGLRLVMDNGQSISGAQLQALLGTTSGTPPSMATAYTTVISAASGTVGTAFTISVTPNGPWPSNEVVTLTSTLAGTFSPTTIAVTGSTVGTATFTPSAAGTGTVNSTTSPSLTNTSGGQTYTATAAASAFPMTFTGPAGTAPTGVQALTQLGSVAGINTAVFNGSGGLVMPTVANAAGYFAAAGITAQHSTVTATFAAGSPKEIQLAIAVDNVGNCFVGVLSAGIVYLAKNSPTGNTFLGPVYNVNPTSSVSIYTDTNYLGVLSDGVYTGGIAVTELPAGYVGIGATAGPAATITQIKVT